MMAGAPRAHRVYRTLLRLLPRGFRQEFAASMAEDFKDQHDDAARSGDGRTRLLWLGTVTGLLWLALREHASAIWRDMVHASRLFRRRPAFTLTTILTLTAGIGVTTATFSIVHAVVLRQIPGPESERLVRVFDISPVPPSRPGSVSNANFVDWRAQATSLDKLALFNWDSGTISDRDRPLEMVMGLSVSDDFLAMTGLTPRLGRLFVADDFSAWHAAWASGARTTPARQVMLLHERLWHRVFGARTDVVGSTITFDGQPVQVIGVLADHPLLHVFSSINGDTVEFWTPGGAWSGVRRRARISGAIGRLAPGVTLEQAQTELTVLNDRLAVAYPEDNAGWTVRLTPLRDAVASRVQSQLWFLFGTSMCVVLIASMNVARLVATLNEGRRREFLTRIAIGASRLALSRQAVVESLLLSTVGGVSGVWLAYALLPTIVAMAPAAIPRTGEITIHPMALLFATVLTAGIGLVCGLASQPKSSRQGRSWGQSTVLAVQVALALVLTVGTTLLVRSMQHVNAQALGFVPQNVMTANLQLPRAEVFDIALAHQRTEELLTRLRAHPGVVAAATGDRPLAAGGPYTVVRRQDAAGEGLRINMAAVSPDYFLVVNSAIRQGRFISATDTSTSTAVVVLNEQAVRDLNLGAQPIGQYILRDTTPLQVVGVLADMRKELEAAPQPAMYVPAMQSRSVLSGQILIRTAGLPEEMFDEVRAIVRDFDPGAVVHRLQTLEGRLHELRAPRRFLMQLVTTFSVLAVGLAVVGLAGVMAETVAQRVREIGIRMALGAQASSIVSMMVQRGARVVVLGVVVGLVVAYQLRSTLDGFVFGIQTDDVVAYGIAAMALIAAGAVACYLPARRAAAVDPVTALHRD